MYVCQIIKTLFSTDYTQECLTLDALRSSCLDIRRKSPGSPLTHVSSAYELPNDNKGRPSLRRARIDCNSLYSVCTDRIPRTQKRSCLNMFVRLSYSIVLFVVRFCRTNLSNSSKTNVNSLHMPTAGVTPFFLWGGGFLSRNRWNRCDSRVSA